MTYPPRIDPIGEALTSLGIVRGSALLDMDECLMVPHAFKLGHPWNLPSRLFIFPIGVTKCRAREQRQLYLLHPELRPHPFVEWIEQKLNVEILSDPPANADSMITASDRQWQHALDLVTTGEIEGLHNTRRFTTDAHIFRAVVLALVRHGPSRARPNPLFDVHAARLLLTLSGVPEPARHMLDLASCVQPPKPQHIRSFTTHWLVEAGHNPPEKIAWAIIRMIELGYVFYDFNGYLEWSELGKEIFRRSVVSEAVKS